MNKSFTKKDRLFTGTIIAGVSAALIGGPALAQEADAPADAVSAEEEIIVTGSRIPRPNLEQPTPVSTIGNDIIENSGTSNLGDIIAELPALSASGTVRANSDSFGDAGGLNFPDLRDLGTARTLTLVNGRRHVGGDAGDTAVDLNSIPPALVERVEVITGGASAVYGSDAVSGVINIILKEDFEGAQFNASYGRVADDDYGSNTSYDFTVGRNIHQGRGNVTLTWFYDRTGRVEANDLPTLDNWGSIANPDDTGETDGIPDRILAPNVVSEFIDEHGVIGILGETGPLGVLGFDANGVPVPQPPRTGENSFAFGSFADPCATCFAVEDWIDIIPAVVRHGFASTFRYEFTPTFRFVGDAKFVTSDIDERLQPSFRFGNDDDEDGSFDDLIFVAENPFINADLRDDLLAVGAGVVLMTRFNGDVGARSNHIKRETLRFVGGFEGEFDASGTEIGWDVAYVYGETRNKFENFNRLIPGNWRAALDAVVDPADGQIKCRRDVPALQGPGFVDPAATSDPCVPFNPFGEQNSQAALDYVSHDAFRKHTITQEVATLLVDFDTAQFLNLPGGPIEFAGGLEYRKETSENINDPFVKSGLSETAPQPDAFGEYDVSEGFIEFNAPILADRPLAYRLSLDGAYRYADYSTVGGAEAWKVGGVWAPVRDLTFRGTYSEAVRAPNITEAFLPPTSAFFGVDDPCDADNINDDPDRAANCAALGIPPGFQAIDNASVQGTASGNPDLDAESSESYTFGVVLQPRWIEGLAITLDHYNIEIRDAILFVQAQTIFDNCVDSSGGPDPAFCSLFTRGADNNINFVTTTFINASALETSGQDLQITYGRDAFGGRLNFSLNLNHLEKFDIFEFQNLPEEINIEAGEIGNPEWSLITAVNYARGPLTLIWQSRYEGEVSRFAQGDDIPEDISPSYVEAVWYHDLVARYEIEGIGEGLEIFGGVNNVFGEELPLALTGNTPDEAAYEVFDRFVFAGLRAKF